MKTMKFRRVNFVCIFAFRSFDCMAIGDKGVKIVRPEDGGGLFHKPGTDADIDAGFDDIEEYDENAVVRRRKHILPMN